MTIRLEVLPTAVFLAVMVCWFVFAGVFLFRKWTPRPPERKRDLASSTRGIVLQGLAYALVWAVPRRMFTSIVPMGKPVEIALDCVTVFLAIGSVWMVLAAVRALGKQWAVVARVVEGHKLVTEGPYRLVRNPIYTGMLGMMLATGLAISDWIALVAAVLLFTVGTWIRVRSEERLLRETFGAEFEAYARRVPAVLPRLF